MGAYRLSKFCEEDIAHVYEFGIEKFGLDHARNYLVGLHKQFQTLADYNGLGIDFTDYYPLLKRFPYKSHMIFFIQVESGIFVVRTLSQSMDYVRHLKL